MINASFKKEVTVIKGAYRSAEAVYLADRTLAGFYQDYVMKIKTGGFGIILMVMFSSEKYEGFYIPKV